MAYQFMDGFDTYGNNYNFVAGYPWSTLSSTPNVTISDFRFSPPGSTPGGCLYCGGSSTYAGITLSSSQATTIVGVGVKVGTLPTNPNPLIVWQDTSGNGSQLALCLLSTGALQFYRGTSTGFTPVGTALGSASAASTIQAGAWYGLLTQATINGTTGAAQCYVNGSNVAAINFTGTNTQNTTNANATQIIVCGGVASGVSYAKYDDFFVWDTTGAANNALPTTDVRILSKMPSGNGNYTNWTPNGLVNNWQNANNTPPNIADYNANNVSTTKDSYAMQSAGLAVAPYIVVVRASLERDDASTHTPGIFVRSGSSDSAGVVTPALTSSYLYYDAVFTNDPATSTTWTGPGADAAQVGVIEG